MKLLLPLLALAVSAAPKIGPEEFEPKSDLRLRQVFPRKPWMGKTAFDFNWSYDDRYVAFRWNPYDAKGNDLWVYDTKSKKLIQLTSIEKAAKFDPVAQKAIDRYKTDAEEEKKREGKSEQELRELDVQDRIKNEERKTPLPTYGGVNSYSWAHKSNELVFEQSGELFRLKIGDESPTRLTRTLDQENNPQFSADDSALFFQRDNGIYKMRFAGGQMEQLNPNLSDGMSLGNYFLSPDGKYIILDAFKQNNQRMVDYITYRGRFAQAAKTPRTVLDDKNSLPTAVYVADTDPGEGKEWKATQVWKTDAGDEYSTEIFGTEPWAKDSSKAAFTVINFKTNALEVHTIDPVKKADATVYKSTFDGDVINTGYLAPFFTPDGSKIITLMDNSGFEQAWMVDPVAKTARQVTKGDWVTYPISMFPDGKHLLVRANKELRARSDLYSVDIDSGEMTRLTHQDGTYGFPTASHNGKNVLATFANWTNRIELYAIENRPKGDETKLTTSHHEGFDEINRLKPTIVNIKNRAGQDVQAMIFLPPGYKPTDKRPLMVGVYGGPLDNQRAVVDGRFFSSYYLFNMYLAYAMGYVTISVDPRGMSENGAAWSRANMNNPGQNQLEDLVDSVNYMKANYGIDSEKVAVSGWSFGGFQTLYCMLKAPDVFTLGIAGAPVTEWQNYNFWYDYTVISQSIADTPEDKAKYSLLPYAKNLKSPIMIMHGMEDTNVLFQDTVKLYRQLQQYGKGPLVELVVDPTGTHGLGGDIGTYDRFAIQLGFLMKHWGPYDPSKS